MKERYGITMAVVPAATFTATAAAVLQAGLRLELTDVSLADYNLNVDRLPPAIPNTRSVVIPVHMYGNEVTGLQIDQMRAKGYLVLEDCCETINNPLRGDAAAYSLYACHHIPAGVGGMVIANDKRLLELIQSYANHGRSSEWPSDRFNFVRVGYSSRMTEIQAAMANHGLDNIKKSLKRRKEIVKFYNNNLPTENLILPRSIESDTHMMYPILLRRNSRGITRDQLCSALLMKGVETRPMPSLVGNPVWKGWDNLHINNLLGNRFPNANTIAENGFYIGCHPGLTPEDCEQIVDLFKEVMK